MPLKVLIIDKDPAPIVAQVRPPANFEIATAKTSREGIQAARKGGFDVVLLDADVADPDAFAALEALKTMRPEPEVILIAASAKMDHAVRAIKLGAGDYFSRQAAAAQLPVALERAVRRGPRDPFKDRGLVGRSPEMQRLHGLIDRAAESTDAVLILGEAGSGKERVARAIHGEGRPAEPFLAVRVVGARKEEAEREYAAALAAVKKGTLYIHEASGLPPSIQDQLAARPPAGARIIASTGRNLLELVGRGLFRQDLFDAFSRIIISVPPLRERRDDISLIVQSVMERRSAAGARSAKTLDPDALSALLAHDWPGNVGELEQAVERACELGDGVTVERRHLPPSIIQSEEVERNADTATGVTRSLREMESEIIRRLLIEQQGNTDTVSKLLKIDRSTLYRKIKRYGIDLDRLR